MKPHDESPRKSPQGPLKSQHSAPSSSPPLYNPLATSTENEPTPNEPLKLHPVVEWERSPETIARQRRMLAEMYGLDPAEIIWHEDPAKKDVEPE